MQNSLFRAGPRIASPYMRVQLLLVSSISPPLSLLQPIEGFKFTLRETERLGFPDFGAEGFETVYANLGDEEANKSTGLFPEFLHPCEPLVKAPVYFVRAESGVGKSINNSKEKHLYSAV